MIKSMITLLNWTQEEIEQLDEINPNWIMLEQFDDTKEKESSLK